MTALPVVRFFTHPEFVGFESASLKRHELVDGQSVAMAGASPRHVAVATGAQYALEAATAPFGCHAHGADLRVYVSSTGLSAYPDVTVTGGTWRMDAEDASAVVNPTVGVHHWQRGADGDWSVGDITDPRASLTLANGAVVEISSIYARTAELPSAI